MATEVQITPSAAARQIFSRLIPLANKGRVSLDGAVALSADLIKDGIEITGPVHELREEGWISPAPGGGWWVGAGWPPTS